MRFPVLAIAAFSTSLLAQDFIHYKFDANCAGEVINYASGAQALPANGTLQTNTGASPFDTGRFGGCLAGGSASAPTSYNRVLTGWDPAVQNLTGDVTIAWFMRQRAGTTLGTALNYLMGAPSGGFRLFTNGAASTGLIQREILASGGNSGRDFTLPAATTNVQTLASAGWVHVAIVVNSTNQTADWFIDGSSVFQLTNVPGALISLSGQFVVGSYSTTATGAGSAYDLDEFLISKRAYSATEILQLSQAPHAGDGDYTSAIPSQCGAGNVVLGSTGGAPTLGNANYALTVTTATPSLFLLLAGLDRCQYGGSIPLPLDGTPLLSLLSGCWILTDAPVIVNGVTSGGAASLPLAIPSAVGNLGLGVFSQSLGLDVATLASSMSNGFATSIGQ